MKLILDCKLTAAPLWNPQQVLRHSWPCHTRRWFSCMCALTAPGPWLGIAWNLVKLYGKWQKMEEVEGLGLQNMNQETGTFNTRVLPSFCMLRGPLRGIGTPPPMPCPMLSSCPPNPPAKAAADMRLLMTSGEPTVCYLFTNPI